MKNFIVLFFASLFFLSCKKETSETVINTQQVITYYVHDTISGTLYSDCNYNSDSNRKVIVEAFGVDYDVLFSILTDSFYTDSQGHFSHPLNYTVNSTSPPLYDVTIPGCCLFLDWPKNVNVPIVTNDTMHLKIKLQVSNPHTSLDTLFYQINSSPYNYVVGPFTNGVFSSVDLPRNMMGNFLDSTVVTFRYAISFNNIAPYNFNAVYKTLAVYHQTCFPSDTATLIVN